MKIGIDNWPLIIYRQVQPDSSQLHVFEFMNNNRTKMGLHSSREIAGD